jgi:hypothetical protein|tara:strand:- start:278 stop:484 length:207 start_codon:yes stop_codon:yes gene_type:complete
MVLSTSGNQYKNSLAAGILISELIEYYENVNDKTLPTANLKHINTNASLAFCSRNRKIKKEACLCWVK